MSPKYLDELEGPLATAVQATWDSEITTLQLEQCSNRILNQLGLVESSELTRNFLPESNTESAISRPAANINQIENRNKRWLVWSAIAMSALILGFFASRYELRRAEQIAIEIENVATEEPNLYPLPSKDVAVNQIGNSNRKTEGIAENQLAPMTMGFIPKVFVHAISVPVKGDNKRSKVILYGKGPSESIALGQRFPLASDPALENFVHIFEPHISPRSRVLEKTSFHGPFAVSPDGKSIVTQEGMQIDTKTEKAIQLPGDWSLVERVQFAGSHRLVLMHVDQKNKGFNKCRLEILEYPEIKKLREFGDVPWDSRLVNMNKDQTFDSAIAINSSDRKIFIHDLNTKQRLNATMYLVDPDLHAIAISPDGKWLATSCGGGSGIAKVYDVASGKLKYELSNALDDTMCFAFSPDGEYLAAGKVENLIVYEVKTGDVVKKFPKVLGHADQIFWSSDSRSVTCVYCGYVQNQEVIYPSISHWWL